VHLHCLKAAAEGRPSKRGEGFDFFLRRYLFQKLFLLMKLMMHTFVITQKEIP
jgi:hypothetical protein